MSLFGDPPPDRPRRRRVAGFVVFAAVAAGFTTYLLVSRSRPAPSTMRPSRPAPRASTTSESPEPARTTAPEAPAEPSAPTRARLRVEADVDGASVFLDRRFVGTAPLTVDDIEPGRHRLNVAADGYETYAEELELAPGTRAVSVRFKEVKLDESVDVVHRHALGSCRGRLKATPRELRFDASPEKDSFRTPLADVERFEMDYLRSNLAVGIRGGRTYNFSSRDGSPDLLFAFHQNVERVRSRR